MKDITGRDILSDTERQETVRFLERAVQEIIRPYPDVNPLKANVARAVADALSIAIFPTKVALSMPELKFKSDWSVKLFPFYNGHTTHFHVSKDNKKVSVFLDIYGLNGPEWEALQLEPRDDYPRMFAQNDTESLLNYIAECLDGALQ